MLNYMETCSMIDNVPSGWTGLGSAVQSIPSPVGSGGQRPSAATPAL